VDFDSNAQLDTSQVSDVRGSGGGGLSGGGGFPGGGLAVGGGVAGLLVTVLLAVLGISGGVAIPGGDTGGDGSNGSSLAEQCSVQRPDRFRQDDCRNIAIFNDLQDYWSQRGAAMLGVRYRDPRFVLFSQAVSTGCGQATSAVGPFYCPADERIYIDLSFYTELRDRFGATGEFAQAYVVAHEFGHHIQVLTGASARSRQSSQSASQASVTLELQADCLAGAWAKNAGAGPLGQTTEKDLQQALDAASAIGDDRIQQQTQGRVNPDTWTHGSSQQRHDSFSTGYTGGDPRDC
jgi:predicted metalloprotease